MTPLSPTDVAFSMGIAEADFPHIFPHMFTYCVQIFTPDRTFMLNHLLEILRLFIKMHNLSNEISLVRYFCHIIKIILEKMDVNVFCVLVY